MPKAKQLKTLAKISITIFLILLIYISIDFSKISIALDFNLTLYLLLAVSLCIVQSIFNAIRLHKIFSVLPATPTFRTCLAGTYASIAINRAIPTFIGGDAYKLYIFVSRGIPGDEALTAIVIDRLIALIGVCLLFAIALLGLAFTSQGLLVPGISVIDWRTALAIGFFSVVLVILSAVLLKKHGKKLDWMQNVKSYVLMIANQREVAAHAFIISLLAHCITGAIFFVGLLAIDVDVPISALLILPPIILFATVAPVSAGGFGAREAAIVFGLGLWGVSSEDALAVAIFTLATAFLNALIGIFPIVAQAWNDRQTKV